MKKQIIITIFITVVFLFGSATTTHAAIQTIPVESAPAIQQDKFQTDLFTGSASYTYPISTPKGTNDLTPNLTFSYNSLSAKDLRASEGFGWRINQDYIERDVHFTPNDTSDDTFKLHFKGASYDLVYVASENRYHTKIESFLNITRISSGGSNSLGEYWQVITTDGTKYRFGYTTNAELLCGGHTFAASWHLDQVEDMHLNHIYYTYLQSNGIAYLSKIEYNNDKARTVDITYSNNSTQRQVFPQGCTVTESLHVNTIQVKANGNPVHEYDVSYSQTSTGQNYLNSITQKGSDGSSLNPTSFGYNADSTGNSSPIDYTNGTNIDAALDHSDVQLCDMNGDGFPDLVKTGANNGGNYTWQVKLNNGKYFAQNWITMATLPVQLGIPSMKLMDLNGDGKCDIVQTVYRGGPNPNYDWFVWLNTSQNGSLSFSGQQKWEDNINFDQSSGLADSSLVLIDMNGDGLPDIVHVGQNNDWAVYLNMKGQNTWNTNNITWAHGVSSFNNPNIKVVDVNGDGYPDLVESDSDGGPNETYKVYINTGTTFLPPVKWIDNANIDAMNLSNHNVTFADVNGDGLPDIVRGNGFSNNSSPNTSAHWQVLYNMGDHFSTTLQTWFDAPMDGSNDFNMVKLADLNGDGQVDVLNAVFGKWDGFVSNSAAPGALSDITTQQGGKVHFQYTPSTNFPVNSIGDLPFSLWVVQKMITNNGMIGVQNTNNTTTYSYFNGLYLYPQREFRGFGEIDVTDPKNNVSKNYFNQDDARQGKPSQVLANDASSNPYTKTEDSWTNSQTNGVYSSLLSNETKSTYDGAAANPKVVETDYQYDDYGNMTKKSELGDVAITGDERFTHTVYTTNSSNWLVNTVSDTYLNGPDDATKINETWNYYDTNTNLTDAPTKGDLTKQVKWLNGGTNPVTSYVYDNFGNQIQLTDANNHITKNVYGIHDTTSTYPDHTINAKNQMTDTVYDLGTGNVLSTTDPNGFTTTSSYDPFGRISKEIDPYDTSSFPTLSYQYFDTAVPQGKLISKRQTTGASATFDTYTFIDGLNRTIQTRGPAQNTSQQIITDTFYDPVGKIAKQTVPHTDNLSTSYATPLSGTRSTSTAYDAIIRPITIVNPQGSTKSILYDHFTQTTTNEKGNKTKTYVNAYDKIMQVDEFNASQTYSTKYFYDTNNNLTKITDAENNNTTYAYDTVNNKIQQIDSDLGVWHYVYDPMNNLIQQTDNRGIVTTKAYDELNRVTQMSYPSDSPITYQYDIDKIGALSQVTDAAGTVSYIYDNRLRKTQEQRVTDGTTWTTQYGYDASNHLISQTNPDGETLTYVYNPQEQVGKLTGIVTAVDYNAQGQMVDRQFANSLTTNYTYNTDDFRLNRIQTGTIQDIGYTYDSVGNVASTKDNLLNKTQAFGYDNLDRLTSAQETGGYQYAYGYNDIGNLTNFTDVNTSNAITYTYGQNAGAHAMTSSTENAQNPTPTPTAGGGTELLTAGSWHITGNNGSSEQDKVIPSNSLSGMSSVQITFDLHGMTYGGGDDEASIIFVQNDWRAVNIAQFGQNGKDGPQTITVPLTSFHKVGDSTIKLDPAQPVSNLHARFWNSGAFTVDITSVKLIGSAAIPTPTPTPSSSTELLTGGSWHFVGNNGSIEQDKTIPSNSLNGISSVQVTFDLHGMTYGGGDDEASIIFVQNDWRAVNIAQFGQNGKDGPQTITVPLTSFHKVGDSTIKLDPAQPVSNLHARFWNSGAFTVDITSVKLISSGPTPTPTFTPTPTPTFTPTPTPTPTSGIELLTRNAWHLTGNNGSVEQDIIIPSNSLNGKTSAQITFDFHGASFGGGDDEASIIFVQNDWRVANLTLYGQNGKNGTQTVTIPLSSFHKVGDSTVILDPTQPVSNLHARFWNSGAFTVDITSVKLN